MTQYGILDLSSTWPLPKNHQVYQTELNANLLDIIDKFGFEKAFNYLESQDERKILVERSIDNIILVMFLAGSGGHFLTNCLSLSDDILISKYPDIKDRCDFFCSKYDEENDYWNDVNLISQVEGGTKYFFNVSHPEEGSVKTLWNFWSGSDKIILFKNSLLFCTLRKCIVSPIVYYEDKNGNRKLKHIISTNQDILVDTKSRLYRLDKVLEKYNINLITYKDLPSNTKKEIQKLFNDKKDDLRQNYSFCKLKTKKQFYFWDVNWFLDEEEFILNTKKLYDSFELGGFDIKLIIKCYHSWMNAMCRTLENNYESGLINKSIV